MAEGAGRLRCLGLTRDTGVNQRYKLGGALYVSRASMRRRIAGRHHPDPELLPVLTCRFCPCRQRLGCWCCACAQHK